MPAVRLLPFPAIATPRGTIPHLRAVWLRCFGVVTPAKA